MLLLLEEIGVGRRAIALESNYPWTIEGTYQGVLLTFHTGRYGV